MVGIIQGPMITRDEAAALIGVTVDFLMNCARRRSGPAFYKLSGKTVLYPRDELLEWHASRRMSNAQPVQTS